MRSRTDMVCHKHVKRIGAWSPAGLRLKVIEAVLTQIITRIPIRSRRFFNVMSSRTRFIFTLFAVLNVLIFATPGKAQSYGPPNLLGGETLYLFSQTTIFDYNIGHNVDIYNPVDTSNTNSLMVDENGGLWDSNYIYYGSNWNAWAAAGFFAVDSDKVTVENVPTGIVVVSSVSPNWTVPGNITNTVRTGQSTSYAVPTFWNGSAFVTKYFSIHYPDSIVPTYFQIGGSPWYLFPGNGGHDFVLDVRSGWPSSNSPFNDSLPFLIYVNEHPFSLIWLNVSVDGATTNEIWEYARGEQVVTFYRQFNGGAPASFSGSFFAELGNEQFSGTFDANTFQIGGNIPGDIAISISALTSSPQYGPAFVSWDHHLLLFYYTTQDGKDLYWSPDSGDGNGDYTVIVSQNDSVVAMHGNMSLMGTCDAGTHALNFAGAVGAANLFAMDANGNPIGLPFGMTLLFGSSGPGNQILRGDGSVYTPPTYSYQRPDASWVRKFATDGNGNALPDGIYLVQDETGNYTAPPYSFQAASGDTVVNAINGWPATNIYPQQLFINGIYCQMVSGSQYDSGAGFPRNGGVSYRAWAYDLTVVVSWTWDTSTGFQGFLTGKYGQSSSFKGSWDGLNGFTNMTNGAIASVPPPTGGPAVGPPVVSVNGSMLQYSASASAAVNANPPFEGAISDVYIGSLGQTLTIDNMGGVQYVPTSLSPGSPPISGSYSFATKQFTFGASGNTVTITNPDGSSSTAVITATDTSGHNLATPSGGSTNDGVTELAGGLDVRGNTFTLGSWMTGNESVYGFGLAYNDASSGASQLSLTTSRAAVNWVWGHPSTDGGYTQVTSMSLDNTHRVLLYDPTPGNTSTVGVVLDPNAASGNSGVGGTFRVWQRGNVSMGQFTNGTRPPVPDGQNH